ncbi:MAG: Mth938-like domain-containing protein, partial [Candidatus Nanohaloarchaea archaeon]|nr:Mth938-like domain-containing protein [Candidatus Nanohaloarchaea archaeon]
MRWEECLNEEVYRREENPQQAKNLYRMAQVRKEDNRERKQTEEKVPLIVESYWETIKQFITALLNLEGFKSYSQECLVVFLEEFYDFKRQDIELMDQLRRLRNDVDYRGEFLDKGYLERKQARIKDIIAQLEKTVKEKLPDNAGDNSMPEVESYDFGKIVIDGKSYENDVIIFPDHVHSGWWRDEGHKLQPQDLDKVVEADPDKLIIGQGYNSRMKVPKKTRKFLEKKGIDFEVQSTRKAWKKLNSSEGDVVGAFHLTC